MFGSRILPVSSILSLPSLATFLLIHSNLFVTISLVMTICYLLRKAAHSSVFNGLVGTLLAIPSLSVGRHRPTFIIQPVCFLHIIFGLTLFRHARCISTTDTPGNCAYLFNLQFMRTSPFCGVLLRRFPLRSSLSVIPCCAWIFPGP